MAKTIAALYDSYQDAQRAVSALRANNAFPSNDISILMNHNTEENAERFSKADQIDSVDTRVEEGNQAGKGAGIGAGIGAGLGALGGLLVGVGVVALPGGSVIVAGPLASMLLGAGVGAAAGGIIGGLIGLGIDEDDAHIYAEAVRRGGKLVLVRAADDTIEQAAAILNRFNPIDIRKRSERWRADGWSGRYSEDDYRTTDTSTVRLEEDFRKHYSAAPSGSTYETYRPAYRFGSKLASDRQLRSHSDWKRVEPLARDRWNANEHDSAWEQVRDYVRYGWDRARTSL